MSLLLTLFFLYRMKYEKTRQERTAQALARKFNCASVDLDEEMLECLQVQNYDPFQIIKDILKASQRVRKHIGSNQPPFSTQRLVLIFLSFFIDYFHLLFNSFKTYFVI